ncbi:5-(carboxyamino)imidazole ribonucleotide synthase [Leptolyngbya sp. 7M]|uniref:5-(carboxyamino)imidazole ribonucleotide synthase n=1 Tax=Leptolyngbya sp. 7M TaxID=2812896 RepID=UPI0021F16195|nr:5-(carboxyamino)imidazole ribonucleotide synthase [Leptolyngbya sp. 7M]
MAIASATVFAPVDDATATAKLASQCDVITFENEFVDLPALAQIAEARFYPTLDSLKPLLDKLDQRQFLQRIAVPTPRFLAIDAKQEAEFKDTVLQFGLPAVLKARRHGYDGQGTFILQDSQSDLPQALPNQWLLEEFIPFECELAVMAARAIEGEVVIYPTVETQQEQQVCRRVYVTAFAPAITAQVEAIARRILAELNYVGVMGIEFFLSRDGKVLVNELAPRTHNSGHYSLDACVTSQFEQQLRAVCGLPLGSPQLTSAGAVMVNLLGYETSSSDYAEKRQRLSEIPQAHLYWYGKTSRPGRKLGHVTVLLSNGQDRTEAETIAGTIEQYGRGGKQTADE